MQSSGDVEPAPPYARASMTSVLATLASASTYDALGLEVCPQRYH